MNLTIKDVSQFLSCSEKEVEHLVKKKEIPFQLLHEKVLFNKHQIVEWALARNHSINISKHKKLSEYQVKTLNTILAKGSFHYGCKLTNDSYIEQMVSKINIEKNIDRDIIVQLLKSREQLMSTAIGNGISLPHPRIPLIVGKNKPLVDFFFPVNPLELNSIDNKPVHTLILLISQTIKQHLSLIAHLSFLLSKEPFRFALENRLPYNEILDIIDKIEKTRES